LAVFAKRGFTEQDLPLFAGDFREGNFHILGQDKRKAGVELGPTTLAQVETKYGSSIPDITGQLRALPGAAQGEYLASGGALVSLLEQIKKTDARQRAALARAFSALGLSLTLPPDDKELVKDRQAFGIAKGLVEAGRVDLTNLRGQGLDSIERFGLLVQPFADIMNTNLKPEEFRAYQLNILKPTEVVQRYLTEPQKQTALIAAIEKLSKQENPDYFQDKRRVKDLQRISGVLGSQGKEISLASLIPLTAPVSASTMPLIEEMLKTLSALASAKALSKLRLFDFYALLDNQLLEAKLLAQYGKDKAVTTAAGTLAQAVQQDATVSRKYLEYYTRNPERVAEQLHLSGRQRTELETKVKPALQGVLRTAVKDDVSYSTVKEAVNNLARGRDVDEYLRRRGIEPQFEHGVKWAHLEEFLGKSLEKTEPVSVGDRHAYPANSPKEKVEQAFWRMLDPAVVSELRQDLGQSFTLKNARGYVRQQIFSLKGKLAAADLGEAQRNDYNQQLIEYRQIAVNLTGLKEDTAFYPLYKQWWKVLDIVARSSAEEGSQTVARILGQNWRGENKVNVGVTAPNSLTGPEGASTTAQVQDNGDALKLDALSNFMITKNAAGKLEIRLNTIEEYNLAKGAHELFHIGIKNIARNPEKITDEKARKEYRDELAILYKVIRTESGKTGKALREEVDRLATIEELGPNEVITRFYSLKKTAEALSKAENEFLVRLESTRSGSGFVGHANEVLETKEDIVRTVQAIQKMSDKDLIRKIYQHVEEQKHRNDAKVARMVERQPKEVIERIARARDQNKKDAKASSAIGQFNQEEQGILHIPDEQMPNFTPPAIDFSLPPMPGTPFSKREDNLLKYASSGIVKKSVKLAEPEETEQVLAAAKRLGAELANPLAQIENHLNMLADADPRAASKDQYWGAYRKVRNIIHDQVVPAIIKEEVPAALRLALHNTDTEPAPILHTNVIGPLCAISDKLMWLDAADAPERAQAYPEDILKMRVDLDRAKIALIKLARMDRVVLKENGSVDIDASVSQKAAQQAIAIEVAAIQQKINAFNSEKQGASPV
ncbi:MAG: hypothetical protein V1662_06070, partial [Candidatus Omnitrophota bacterium]